MPDWCSTAALAHAPPPRLAAALRSSFPNSSSHPCLSPLSCALVCPCSVGGGGGGTVAKDALGNDVKQSAWLKTHAAGDHSLVQGLKVCCWGGRAVVVQGIAVALCCSWSLCFRRLQSLAAAVAGVAAADECWQQRMDGADAPTLAPPMCRRPHGGDALVGAALLQADATYLVVTKDGSLETYGINAVCTHLGGFRVIRGWLVGGWGAAAAGWGGAGCGSWGVAGCGSWGNACCGGLPLEGGSGGGLLQCGVRAANV